ncbi:GNAT family N-acetyltransferase [Uliginosibacterium sp. sgz301328]|uniref:GNAT family N-acetyltransferase n=1 Tax=Uliginosibacterium sp. sgz301328 TaxID=3243764 RepID=UPI00359E547B
MSSLVVTPVDLSHKSHAQALIALLDHYASGEMGGGTPLSAHARDELPARLLAWPTYVGFIAWDGDEAVGLINGFLGMSTFAARPLLNVHDVVVREDYRGRGVGKALLAAAEDAARARDCCKLTLEVLQNNASAYGLYSAVGYRPYELDPAMGQAMFMEKKLY